jgi:hypothetical protein
MQKMTLSLMGMALDWLLLMMMTEILELVQ